MSSFSVALMEASLMEMLPLVVTRRTSPIVGVTLTIDRGGVWGGAGVIAMVAARLLDTARPTVGVTLALTTMLQLTLSQPSEIVPLVGTTSVPPAGHVVTGAAWAEAPV